MTKMSVWHKCLWLPPLVESKSVGDTFYSWTHYRRRQFVPTGHGDLRDLSRCRRILKWLSAIWGFNPPLYQISCVTLFWTFPLLCVDNNECASDPNLCGSNGVCQNTPGSFSCDCQRGFSLDPNAQTCEGLKTIDVNLSTVCGDLLQKTGSHSSFALTCTFVPDRYGWVWW